MKPRGGTRQIGLSVRVEENRGGPVASDIMGRVELDSSGARTVLLLVHGFNNTRKQAEKSFGKFSGNVLHLLEDSRIKPDVIAHFHWPGNAAVGLTGCLDVFAYAIDIEKAKDAADRLAAYLWDVATPGFRLVMVGHSMGCRVILEALQRFRAGALGAYVDFVVLMAAAVPIGMALPGARLSNVQIPPQRLVKFHSTKDMALSIGFPLGQWRAGGEEAASLEAVGRFGAPANLGHGVATDNGHSDYWGDQIMASAVANVYNSALPLIRYAYKRPEIMTLEARALEERTLSLRKLSS